MCTHCLIQYKVVHRVHWSTCKLARIDPECDRSSHINPHVLGMSGPFSVSGVSMSFSPSPIIGLFGVLPSDSPSPPHFTNCAVFLTPLVRRVVLLN